ncbi:MAG TPA: glycosyltransferase family 39 protein [Candidatus Acidoferrales bacterium]|nr:glycosyltransferase family 39 protein [Candidatus Acidoferrales bacterium]
MEDTANPRSFSREDVLLLGGLTLFTFALHLVFYKGYGFFRDELYFIACSHLLDWGYVDQPPGVAVVAWAARGLLGDSLFAVRFVPCVFAALQVLLTGLTARAMGGGRYAQFLTCACVIAAPGYFGSWLNTDMFMELGWAACAWVAARILSGESPRLWLLFGLFAGLAMQGKHAMVFFGFAFAVGLLISPQRKMAIDPWLWAGGAVAFLIALPNLIWEYSHDWATYVMLSNVAKSDKNVVLSPLAYLLSNADALGRFAFPVWVAGLVWCLFAPSGRRFRALGWAWVIAYVTFLALKGKDYYLTPMYAMLFAAGAVVIEAWIARRGAKFQAVLRPAIPFVVLLGGMIAWPFGMPVLPVEKFIAYAQALGAAPAKTESIALDKLPQQYADMFGWPEMAAAAAQVYNAVPAGERSRCGILTRNYGEAGAIDYFGRQYGLPGAISGHQNYWLWGPGVYTGECLVVIGYSRERLEQLFGSVTQAGETFQQYAISYENHRPIWVCREPKFKSLEDIWPELKTWR